MNRDGNALLLVLPSEEEGMMTALSEKKIPIKKLRGVNPDKNIEVML